MPSDISDTVGGGVTLPYNPSVTDTDTDIGIQTKGIPATDDPITDTIESSSGTSVDQKDYKGGSSIPVLETPPDPNDVADNASGIRDSGAQSAGSAVAENDQKDSDVADVKEEATKNGEEKSLFAETGSVKEGETGADGNGANTGGQGETLGPDGKPITGQKLGPDGKPIGPDGKPIEEGTIGPDGKPIGPDGKPIEGEAEVPVGAPVVPQGQASGSTEGASSGQVQGDVSGAAAAAGAAADAALDQVGEALSNPEVVVLDFGELDTELGTIESTGSSDVAVADADQGLTQFPAVGDINIKDPKWFKLYQDLLNVPESQLTEAQVKTMKAIKDAYAAAGPNSTDAALFGLYNNSVRSAADIVKQAQALVDSLPESPQKTSFLNYLQKVSDTLNKLSTLLAELLTIDTAQARKATKAETEAAITGIDKFFKAERKRIKAERKAKKKAKLGVFGKILNFIKIAFLVIAAAVVNIIPGLGQIASAFLIAQAVDSFSQTIGIKFSLTSEMIKGVGNMVVAMVKVSNPDMAEKMEANIQVVAKTIVTIMVIAAILLSPVTFAMGGSDLITKMLMESGLVTSDKAKMILGLTMAVAAVVATIIITVIMFLIPGMQGAAIGNITRAGATLAEKAGGIAKLVNTVLSIVTGVATVADGTNNAILSDLQAKMAKIRGDSEAEQVMIQTLIKVLKDLIKELQAGLNDFGKQISTIQSGLQEMKDELSGLMSELHAIRAN